MKSCTCASPDSPVEAPRPSLHACDGPNGSLLAPRRLARKPSKLQTTLEVTKCRFGSTSRQAPRIQNEEFAPQKDWAPIFHAVFHDRDAALRHFLQTGVSPDDTGPTGVPLLCIAAACGSFEMVNILLEAGAYASAASRSKGETALHIAIKSGCYDIIDLLLSHRADLEAVTTHKGETALHYAAADFSSIALVTKLLKLGAKVDVRNLEGQTPAAIALQAHNLHVAFAIINMARGKPTQLTKEKEMLLQYVENMEDQAALTDDFIVEIIAATCDPDSTSLVEAIKRNNWKLVRILLEKGSDPHRPTANGLLPIFVAVKFADLKIIKMLVQSGANVTSKGPGNLDALQLFFKTFSSRSEESIVAIVEYLLAKGADGLAQYSDGKTLLHRSVIAGTDRAEVVRLLIKNGVEVNVRDADGRTALHLAASNGLVGSTQALLDGNADIRIADSKKRTPLLRAVQHQQWPVVPLLVVYPAITFWDMEGSTALHHIAQSIPEHDASWAEIAAVVRLFCERGACRSMRDRSGATPLIQAVKALPEEGISVVKALLIEGGRNRNCVGHEDHERCDALQYAATLGKPLFVEALLEHGAPVDLEAWTNGKRQANVPAASRDRILELIVTKDRSRQVEESQRQPKVIHDTRMEIIKTDSRTSSALSGYHADCEQEYKRGSHRHVAKKNPAKGHFQVPAHRQISPSPSPTFPNRTTSRRQRPGEIAALYRQPMHHDKVAMFPTPGSTQTVPIDTRIGHSRQHNDYYMELASSPSAYQVLRAGSSVFPPRSSSRHRMTTLPKTVMPLEDSRLQTNKSILLGKELSTIVPSPHQHTLDTLKDDASPTAMQAPLPVSKEPEETTSPTPLSTADRLAPTALPKRSATISLGSTEANKVSSDRPLELRITSQLPLSSTSAVSSSAKSVQPVRADSGVSLTQDVSTAGSPPALETSESTSKTVPLRMSRQSGGELSSWLEISNMLDRL